MGEFYDAASLRRAVRLDTTSQGAVDLEDCRKGPFAVTAQKDHQFTIKSTFIDVPNEDTHTGMTPKSKSFPARLPLSFGVGGPKRNRVSRYPSFLTCLAVCNR